MIITRTPFRISFFGGGTDYPGWFEQHGGAVLATSIDKYCYITCRRLPPFFEHKHRIVYSRIENVKEIEDIEHPSVRAVLSWAGMQEGLEIHHDGDLPARSGLGSSSSFTVGLIHAIHALHGRLCSTQQLATEAIHIEQDIIRENVGSQDQISAAIGGFNKIDFRRDGSFDVNPVVLPPGRRAQLESHLMLFFTGTSRIASEIAKSKIENLGRRQEELMQMRRMVDQGLEILQDPAVPIAEFGVLLDQAWRIKRTLSDQISNHSIDELYERALRAGAVGGKLLGAGGGGFFLVFAAPDRQVHVRAALGNLVQVPFSFDNTGSKVVLYQPNGL